MVDAKILIVSSFALMVVLGVIGVIIYYQQLEPFRLIASINAPGNILDKVTYIEYTVKDLEGNTYMAKLYNNPANRSGVGELYDANGTLLYKIRYTYNDNGLVSGSKILPNGTIIFNYTGGYIVELEDAFFTGVNYTISPNGTIVAYDPFPGAAPIYLPVYLADYLQIDWNLLASITKPRNVNISRLVDLNIATGKTIYNGNEVNAIIIQTEPFVLNPPNKWAASRITMAITVDDKVNLPVVTSWSIEAASAGKSYLLSFNLTKIEFTG